ncbi:MAG TPA: signal recognition particle-docking protein FtsY [Candidatus Polarisedimenticolia bacterium]|nr:signal recognition particle-docking protein FtsY [Candidatus Polarisedimenticolia bacterium]
MKLLDRLAAGLARSRDALASRLTGLFHPGEARRVEEILDDLEETLIQADIGPSTAAELVGQIRKTAGRDRRLNDVNDLKVLLAQAIMALQGPGPRDAETSQGPGAGPAAEPLQRPYVIFLVGVNGGGKTTTAAKLASRMSRQGKKGVLAAADTFRAAATDQLRIWSERVGVDLVRHQDGADPSAVVFDALKAAQARRCDFVVVDTAGRLHTKTPLMKELEKIYRIAGREVPGAPHESLLVIDANTGQNGITQAREFLKAGRITGLVLTKLDGTAKGGIAIGVSRALGIPLKYVGVGEREEDLLDFSLEAYVEGLLATGAVSPPAGAAR